MIQARKDFISVAHKGTLENRKPRPWGKSYVTDDVLEKAIDVIVISCSTIAWSMRRHVIKPGSKVITTNNIQKIENNGETVVFLPALHRLMGKWEMLHDYEKIYPDANQRIKSDAFNRVATRVTRTQ